MAPQWSQNLSMACFWGQQSCRLPPSDFYFLAFKALATSLNPLEPLARACNEIWQIWGGVFRGAGWDALRKMSKVTAGMKRGRGLIWPWRDSTIRLQTPENSYIVVLIMLIPNICVVFFIIHESVAWHSFHQSISVFKVLPELFFIWLNLYWNSFIVHSTKMFWLVRHLANCVN